MTREPSVLVVGAGPTGLTLACTLRRFGVDCRVVDRREGLGDEPKALVLWSGALEALRRTGVADEAVGRALALTGASYWSRGRRIGGIGFGDLPGTAFPGPVCLPQPVLERLLLDRLEQLGGSVQWRTEAVGVEITADGARVELGHGDGEREQVEVPWVVGADGTRSRVRESLGIPYEGSTYPRVFLLGDGRLRGPAPAREAQYHLHPDGVLVLVPLPDGGHRVFFDLPDGPTGTDATEGAPDVELLQGLLDTRGPGGLTLTETWWTSRFRVHARLAREFRRGPVFLAGDAAHCHSPAGGQGLNTGVQDGYDLGWKLASVVRGADQQLLDSYPAERRPASAAAVRSADQQTRLWMLRAPLARALRDGVMRRLLRTALPRRRIVPQLAQLHLDHSGSTAVVDLPDAAPPPAVRLGRRMPDTELVAADGSAAGTLHGYLARGRHVVLAVGGRAAAHAVERVVPLLVGRGVSDVVDVLWLRPSGSLIERPFGGGFDVRDEGPPAALSGGKRSWLVYVRPDGVVGARAGTEQVDGLVALLPRRAAPVKTG
ncbi:FAD-dependent monooxygenase [Micromonospora sp. CA-240977]|uniref:FAD-dependent monooxygenase n=1 Tax=Micromonospora sp. CA-240977 TaxID=3239957 RepID=UPI003D909A77